jgi:hypothetical protein
MLLGTVENADEWIAGEGSSGNWMFGIFIMNELSLLFYNFQIKKA